MEIIHADGTPLAAFLEADGTYDPELNEANEREASTYPAESDHLAVPAPAFAPTKSNRRGLSRQASKLIIPQSETYWPRESSIGRIHNACSAAVNSRLGRADNARFLEHFRYVIVASQLLNEYLDHGSLPAAAPPELALDGSRDESSLPSVTTSLYGAAATAVAAFALVYFLHWARSGSSGLISKSRVILALSVFAVLAVVGYAYIRRQWLKFLRRNAVMAASSLTASWQAFELSSSSALSFIQEVELVSKGYRLSTPLPPASRIEDTGPARRCSRLRKALYKAYSTLLPGYIAAFSSIRELIDGDDLERYFEVYDISDQDAKESLGDAALAVLEDDAESLKSLRLLSYRAGILRRVLLSSLMALEADGSKCDFHRWRAATDVMEAVAIAVGKAAERLRQALGDMETINIPQTPVKSGHPAAREKMRSQVRKISMLSSGIKGLQAKMQILREETNRSIEQSEDLTDLGPSLMAQYDSIGTDLKELMQAWETGKASLQSNINKQERRISMASSGASGMRSPVSSIGGLTAVDEVVGTPDDALKALNGTSSNRSSMATTPSDEEQIFEAVAMPRQRSTLTREERLVKMHEDRERQATLRVKRESNTHMLRELETVINLRPRGKTGAGRVTSI